MDEEYDFEIIWDLLVLAVLIAGAWWFIQSTRNFEEFTTYRLQCEKSPSQMHAQSCSTETDCALKCAQRLYDRAHEKKAPIQESSSSVISSPINLPIS